MELKIKMLDDRLDVARVLVKNGYKVWTEARKVGGKNETVLMIEEKGEKKDA